MLAAVLLAALMQFAHADTEYTAAWGPAVGETVPMLDALDQTGDRQTLATLSGSAGLVLVFNRSVDW